MVEAFRFVLTASLYASVVGLVIIIIKMILKSRLSANWHYLLWMVLILKLLVPFGPESAFSLFNAAPEMPQVMTEASDQMGQQYEAPLTAENLHPYQPPAQQSADVKTAVRTENFLPCAWAAGVVSAAVWLVFAFCSLHRRLRQGSPVADERVLQIFAACKARMGINRNDISLVVQELVGTPSLFGVFSPKILLPPSVLSLSDKELGYILLHELAHYKRKDVLVNYLLLVLQALHWFNPAIWYCFKRIRQDMEVATDERVLSVLENTEHKDYGRALLAVLEGFAAPRLAPRLLGMVDDKQNIERRINMIKMAGFFQSRRRMALAVGLVSVVVLAGVLLTSGLTDGLSKEKTPTGYNAETLLKYKTAYVGDNSKVVNLINNLPYAELRREVSLQTKSTPYGVTVNYDLNGAAVDSQQMKTAFHDNAVIMFALIGNVDVITFNFESAVQPASFQYTRAEVQKGYDKDLREYSKDIDEFEAFLRGLGFRLQVHPEKYTPAMSSTPGIRISAVYPGSAAAVRYQAENGALLTWDASTGKVSKWDSIIQLPVDTPVYWSPIDTSSTMAKKNLVTAKLLDEAGQQIGEKHLTIVYDGSLYYSVQPAAGVIFGGEAQPAVQRARTTEEAVSQAILSRRGSYYKGETATEGHIILESEEVGGAVKVYTIASFGSFGFENGVFTKVSGSGAIPTVMTFSKNQNGEYSLLEYKEPMDGAGYTSSIKEMFPRRLRERALSSQEDYADLLRQQEAQAAEYLKSIGRTAEVSGAHVKKQLADINVNASNKLFSETTKYDAFLNSCPYWIGTRERIEDGARYIYETSQGRTSDGYELITFKKIREDGAVVEERQYKIVGDEPQLVGVGP